MRAPKEAAFDFSFYAPYKAAVETAFLSLCAARMQLEEEHTPFAVRAIPFLLKSPAAIREKLGHMVKLEVETRNLDEVRQALELIRETLELTERDTLIPFSAEKGSGKDELLRLLVDACCG